MTAELDLQASTAGSGVADETAPLESSPIGEDPTPVESAPIADDAATIQATATAEPEPDDLLHELSRAMHSAALAQHRRMADEVARLRATQAETVKARTDAEAQQLKRASQADIKEIDAWAKTATELIAAERVRRIDTRRERLQAELTRQDITAERELMAVDVTLEDHEAALEAFFTRLETEADPAAIAQVASSPPVLPSLSDAAEAARRHAIAEFAPIDEANGDPALDDQTVDGAAEVSTSRLMAVMDPGASSPSEAETTTPWPEPRAVAVPAGAGQRPLLRSMPTARPMDRLLGWNRKPSDDPDRKD